MIFLITISDSLASCSLLFEKSSVDVPLGATDIVSLVTDTKGRGDRSFNNTPWRDVTDVKEEYGIEPIVLESAAADDYDDNINERIELGSTIKVTVGFMIGDAMACAADASPDDQFAIVYFSYYYWICNSCSKCPRRIATQSLGKRLASTMSLCLKNRRSTMIDITYSGSFFQSSRRILIPGFYQRSY